MIFSEAKTLLASLLNISYSDISNNSLFSDTELGYFIQAGTNKAWDYKPWAFTEGDRKTTSINDDYYDYPAEYEEESIRRITVAGHEYGKRLFDDYQKHFDDNPTATDKFWSEHKRFYFLNKNAHAVGSEIVVFGKLRAPTLSSSSDLLPFSPTSDNQENSGNHAIVRLAYAEALNSEKLNNSTKGAAEEKRGYGMLDAVWAPMGARRSMEQSQDRPFFDVPDFFSGTNSRSTNIGNFP